MSHISVYIYNITLPLLQTLNSHTAFPILYLPAVFIFTASVAWSNIIFKIFHKARVFHSNSIQKGSNNYTKDHLFAQFLLIPSLLPHLACKQSQQGMYCKWHLLHYDYAEKSGVYMRFGKENQCCLLPQPLFSCGFFHLLFHRIP